MNFQTLQTLLDYHYWARDRVLDAAEALTPEQLTRDLGNSCPSIRDTLVGNIRGRSHLADRQLRYSIGWLIEMLKRDAGTAEAK